MSRVSGIKEKNITRGLVNKIRTALYNAMPQSGVPVHDQFGATYQAEM